jgi:acyl-CoA thioester hydrolase
VSGDSLTNPFEWRVRVYWKGTDAGGIVFYANYLKFFERARTEWLRALGIEQQRLREAEGAMFVVSATDVRYLRPARLDDLLLVTAQVREAGRASLTIAQSARRGSPAGELLCEGTIRIGWVDGITLTPRRMPPSLCQALGLA